jgi:hypothetical protein
MEYGIDMAQQAITKDAVSLDDFIPPAGIEFVCLINKQGRIEQSIFNNGIDITEDKREMFAMGLQLQNSMQSDFDYEFGTVHYTITERENARFVSIPTSTGVLLAKMNKSADPFVFVDKITRMTNSSKISFESSGVCQ